MADNTRRKQSIAGNSTRLRRESVSFGRATKPIKFAPTFATLVNKEIEEEVEKPTDTKEVFKGLVANVPDVVVYHEALKEEQESDESIQKFNGVLMFADVSGFTALTESYTLKGESGVDALTTTLNEYMGMIVECILESGGDILKFAGDAFLALWKVEERSQLKEAISIAAQTSITIQDKCDHFMTDI